MMLMVSEGVNAMARIASLNTGGSSFVLDVRAAGRGDSEALGSGC
jgi:hypothetical protein